MKLISRKLRDFNNYYYFNLNYFYGLSNFYAI
jgi:hypothetical protein